MEANDTPRSGKDPNDHARKSHWARLWHWLQTPVWPLRTDPAGEKTKTDKGDDGKEGGSETLTVTVDGSRATATATRADGDGKDGDGKKKDGGSGVGSTVLKVAGAAATGITATGFVVVVGAAVFWFRFNELHLPATQAISVMPKSELLVQGAQQSIIFVAIGLAAVLLLLFIDPKGQVLGGTLLVLGALALLAVCYLLSTKLSICTGILMAVVAFVLLAGCAAIGHRSGSTFWQLALALFVATLAYSSAVGILVVKQQRYAQGVAILRGADDAGVTGLYVTAGTETIYFARASNSSLDEKGEVRRALFEVDRDGATFAVGPLEPAAKAEARAGTMLVQLISDRERNRVEPETEIRSTRQSEPDPKPTDEAAKGTQPDSETGAPGKDQAAEADKKKEPAEPSQAEIVAKAFGATITVHRHVGKEDLCLVRYGDASKADKLGRWWTSCEVAEKLDTVREVRDRLAFPGRFQRAYDMRVWAKAPEGTPLTYLEGPTGPQCEHAPRPPCGHRYSGGDRQYFVPRSNELEITKIECTESGEDEETVWKEEICLK